MVQTAGSGSATLARSAGTPIRKRRQNHSCEQCRKSKRACDGFLVNRSQSSLLNTSLGSSSGPDFNATLPCSYCVRTKRNCSLNLQWNKNTFSNQRVSQDCVNTPAVQQPSFKPSRVRTEKHQAAASPISLAMDTDINTWEHLFQQPSYNEEIIHWDSEFTTFEGHATAATTSSTGASLVEGISTTISPEFTDKETVPGDNFNDQPSMNSMSVAATRDDDFNSFSFDSESTNFDISHVFTASRSSNSTTASPKYKDWEPYRTNKVPGESMSYGESFRPSLVPVMAAYNTSTNLNRGLICESLLTIYHDVLENNLGCWLAENTCPFQMVSRRQSINAANQLFVEPNPVPEWGGAWSNRMYRRVKKLDCVAQSTKIVRITRSESHAASKSLDLVIMAFATQWAQGSQARKTHSDDSEDDDQELGHNFEQTLRQSVWQQAKRALEEVADLECFRVVYAELIFGLIQTPLGIDTYEDNLEGSANWTYNTKGSNHEQIAEIFSHGGPPIFSERGARKMHALKHRFHKYEEGLQEIARFSEDASVLETSQQIGTEERRTIGLLYWLAVMFDTVSSSIYERPFVVADEECEHDSATGSLTDRSPSSALYRRWELDLYAQDDSQKPSLLRWPCSYEEATRAVARSAAVKVLLFRYVGYLQSALRRNESSQTIEEIIKATISVYRYWNQTHGAFFQALTRDYNNIPSRIKSWFPCIGIPWHLGSLMLADLLDIVDENRLGLNEEIIKRCAINMSTKIRRSSATELADFATFGAPEDLVDMNLSQMPELHFAVNESPLLTEPWTVLLVRAFAKASVVHLTDAKDIRNQDWSILGCGAKDIQIIVRRGKSCVNALRLLGTKSNMARKLSRVFSQQLSAFEGHRSPSLSLRQMVAM